MSHAMESVLSVDRLRQLANDPQQALQNLVALLHSLPAGEEQLEWACEALENCGTPPATALPAIVPLVAHPELIVATWACKLLARMGAVASSAETQLVHAVAHRPELIVREEAARALGSIGRLSNAARAALEAAASSGGPRLKRLAADALAACRE